MRAETPPLGITGIAVSLGRRGIIERLGAAVAGVLGRSSTSRSAAVVSARLRGLLPESVDLAPILHRPSSGAPHDRGRAFSPKAIANELAAIAARTPQQAIEALGERVDSDFESGRLITVDGWVLSETEAHLIALTAPDEA